MPPTKRKQFMTSIQLDPRYLCIRTHQGTSYGGQQQWYNDSWRRSAGCGPTTAATITMYQQCLKNKTVYDYPQFVQLMNTLWTYITPGTYGVDTIERFVQGYQDFLRTQTIHLYSHMLKFNPQDNVKPDNKQTFSFLKRALENQCAVAFLNLDHGQESRLESWHWVTLVGVNFDESHDELTATIADAGRLQTINLGLWLSTTNKRGGFVYFAA